MRYRMLIEYDGSDFHGWQIQPEKPTIQEVIEQALEVVLRQSVSITGSGRTDAGVHARGQVAHFDSDTPTDVYRLMGSLNGILPPSIGILDISETRDTFHARYDARRRMYRYYVCIRKSPIGRTHRYFVKPAPDFEAMNVGARHLLGNKDFSSFCRTKSETKNRICNIQEAEWIEEKTPGHWVFRIEADRFLHGMVRAIVGTLLEIGHGKKKIDDLNDVIDARDRTFAGPAAPPHGLVLEHVSYAD